jgi:hypothetical protein
VSLHLIELQDHAVSVRTLDALLARSPGFANVAGGKPVFGEAARARARLHPREHFNQFWSQLNLDPLAVKNKFSRHAADLAHGHLAAVTQNLQIDDGAVIAVPSSYSRNQLAVLLGIVKQCSFSVTGLVDLALLQAAASTADECIILDLQLHQTVLSRFRKMDGHLVKEQSVAVPFAGLLALHEAWTSLITDEFILQSRFDPLHTAETDQYVYDRLEQWIASTLDNDKALLEINMKGVVHQAWLTRAQFEQRAQTIYERIAKELAALRGADTAVHIRASQFHLPGLAQSLPALLALDDELPIVTCMQHLDYIRRPTDKLQFITRLPVAGDVRQAPAPQQRQPSHVVFNHRALPLAAGRLLFGALPEGLDSARVLPLPTAAFSGGVALVRTSRGLQLELHTRAQVLCNGVPAFDGQALGLGDRLQLGPDAELQLILVEGA